MACPPGLEKENLGRARAVGFGAVGAIVNCLKKSAMDDGVVDFHYCLI